MKKIEDEITEVLETTSNIMRALTEKPGMNIPKLAVWIGSREFCRLRETCEMLEAAGWLKFKSNRWYLKGQ